MAKSRNKQSIKNSKKIHVKIDDSAKLRIATTRARTAIGPQGDHVSAYALFTECAISAVENKPIEDAAKLILDIIDQYAHTNDAQNYFDSYKAELAEYEKTTLNDSGIEQIIESVENNSNLPQKQKEDLIYKLKYTYLSSKESYMRSLIEKQIELHLTLRNKLDLVSFPSEGNILPPTDESARVKSAIVQLKKIHNETFLDNLPVNDVVNAMQKLFWYPKISEDKLIILDSIEWQQIKDKYNKDTKPRDNDIKKLYKVVKNHIELIFTCFYDFLPYNEQIINEFIEQVFVKNKSNLGWNLNNEERQNLKIFLHDNLPSYFKEHREELDKSVDLSVSFDTSKDGIYSDVDRSQISNKSKTHIMLDESIFDISIDESYIDTNKDIPVTPKSHKLRSKDSNQTILGISPIVKGGKTKANIKANTIFNSEDIRTSECDEKIELDNTNLKRKLEKFQLDEVALKKTKKILIKDQAYGIGKTLKNSDVKYQGTATIVANKKENNIKKRDRTIK